MPLLAPVMAGLPPQFPSNLQIYNSYVVDPQWQLKFMTVWCSALGVASVASFPTLARSWKNGRSLKGFFGVSEDLCNETVRCRRLRG